MAQVANPAVIIGLGGTGQWVLTYLKKNLIDTYGEVPKTVRLLSFDTTGEKTEAEVSADNQEREKRAKVGNVALGTGEFIYLGGNIRQICKEIRDEDKHPHVGSWLQAETYLQAYDDDAFDISKGAGQRRPFGRMAVFYDLATGEPQILGKISTAITDVIQENKRQQPVEIYITGSIAGGTGSGMFIDIAHVARKLAEKSKVSFAVRGFIVMQNTFEPVITVQNVLPNAFAAMRELDRFMLVFDRDYPITYLEEHKEPLAVYHSMHSSKLFDSCYLIDSVRSERSLKGIEPQVGIYPSVAECMTALLDPETGDTFAQHYKNVNDDVALAQQEIAKSASEAGTALYSSLGTFTYILPVVDIIERNTYKMVLELLRDRLLTIQESDEGNLRVSGEGNKETANPPREEVSAFLHLNKSRGGILNLQFNNQVASVIESGRTRDSAYIHDTSNLGVEFLNWLLPAEQDAVIAQTANDLQAAMEVSIYADVPNSKIYRDDFHSAADRIARDVQSVRGNLLGREEAGGRRIKGSLHKGLESYADRNVQRLRALLEERLTDLLNGTSDDPLVSRQGKLPYAREWLSHLIQYYDEFSGFMENVIQRWTVENEIGLARDDVAGTKQTMYDNRDATGLLDRIQGMAVKAQDAYIGAENYLLDLERQEVLMRAIIELAESLKSLAQQLRSQVDQWIEVLALGGSVGSSEVGVYHLLLSEQAELQRRREEQARIGVYEYLTNERYEDGLYNRYLGDDKWRDILRHFHWGVSSGNDRIALSLSYGDSPLAVAAQKDEPATVINAHLLISKLRPYFNDIHNETIASRMDDLRTPARAAKELLDNSGALISYRANEQIRASKRNFICANQGTYVNYFDRLADELMASAPTAKENKVIGLTNKHRCIVLSTTDLLASKGTAPYQTACQAYLEYGGNRRLLHNFPAEVNASWYEQRLPRYPIQQTQRLLSPVLVALLEDREMVRRFVLSLFYGLVRIEEVPNTEGQNQYVLRLDRVDWRDRNNTIRLTNPSQSPALLDAMTAFVYTRIEQGSGRRQIWDVTLGGSIGVEPQQIDQTLQRRKDFIISGKEQVVDEFERRFRGWGDLLTADGQAHLIGAFRRFVEENERWIKRGDRDVLAEHLDDFLLKNYDCYIEQYHSELASKILEVVAEFSGDRIRADEVKSLVRRMERYIRDKIEPMHRAHLIGKLPPDKRPNQLIQDLHSIMHLVLWDEIERLEQLEAGSA